MFIFHTTALSKYKTISLIQKTFIWHSLRPKLSHSTLYNSFENGGLKHVDISSKIISLQCSWLQKLCDKNFHKWKIVPSHLINKCFGKSFKFYSCLLFDCKLFIKFSMFYKKISPQWSSSLFALSELPSCILSNFLWFSLSFFRYFSDKGLNLVYPVTLKHVVPHWCAYWCTLIL